MSKTKQLLDSLLWEIYGKQKQREKETHRKKCKNGRSMDNPNMRNPSGAISKKACHVLQMTNNPEKLQKLSIPMLIDVSAILKVEITLMSYFLEQALITRDRLQRHQQKLIASLIQQVEGHDARPKMRFSLLSPTPTKTTTTTATKSATKTVRTQPTSTKRCASVSTIVTSPKNTTTISTTTTNNNNNNGNYKNSRIKNKNNRINHNNNNYSITNMLGRNRGGNTGGSSAAGATGGIGVGVDEAAALSDGDEAASDYNQWLHAMKLVARLPGGTPPEFRRKLWLSLADKYLKSKHVDWAKQQEKCFSEEWREDDEELGIQIVKDLHRTGSNLCTGPAGSINQAKLKRILLGYARYNPEVGYCQGFNMLGALILQVMDKEEVESMKVMIYLVEGILPTGYFYGSMGGLQADMGVFRELMQTKLPRLAKHLQKLQGPIENAYEPPLTNVFTMQWFLTMFCTCLPMSCVLRVWDLVLIEGSDVLLRTAIVLWSLLEERVLSARSADEFYGKMGSFSSELLNGHLTDSNGLIERVVQLGPIADLQKLRNKHLYNIAPLRNKQGLQLYYDDEDLHSDEESRLAVATVWGLPWGRRGSASTGKHTQEHKDRLALDISLLKKQYDRLRERQKQAHVILTTACTTAARQGSAVTMAPSGGQQTNLPVNQLLMGRTAIVMNKGKRVGPPVGAIPPARKPSLPAVLHTKQPERQLRRGETLHWRDTDLSKRRRDSLTWKEIKADRAAILRDGADSTAMKSQKLRSRMGKSDSSSYSEDSDGDLGGGDDDDGSSTDTSLCDDDDPSSTGDKTHANTSIESSPKRKAKLGKKLKEVPKLKPQRSRESSMERQRPKSWAPTTHEIPFMLMTSDSPVHSGDEKKDDEDQKYTSLTKDDNNATDSSTLGYHLIKDLNWPAPSYSEIAGDLASSSLAPLHVETDILELPVVITSTSQLSPMPDITTYLNSSTISPLPTPKPLFVDSVNSLGSTDGEGEAKKTYDVNDDGVTNQYFERVNSVERPTKLELFYSLSEEESVRNAYEFRVDGEGESEKNAVESNEPQTQKKVDIDEEFVSRNAETANSKLCSDTKEKVCDSENIETESQNVASESVPQSRIPNEKKNDYKEVLNMTIAEKSKLPLNSSSRKRRDPRRLTLTRSSTIELEERFQALERRLSEDIIIKTSVKQENTKHIPSTEDLEARYNTLEKQLSCEKQIESQRIANTKESDEEILLKPRTHEHIPSTANLENRFNALAKQMSSSGTDTKEPVDLNDEKESANKKSTEENEEKQIESKRIADAKECDENILLRPKTHEHIPSTANLENRFNALAKQMSSSGTDAKEPLDLNDENKSENKKSKEENEKKNKIPSSEEVNSESKSTSEKIESQSTRENDTKEKADKEDKPRLKKLPSTAELEDRFNALERKMSIQKSSPAKTKKEPPDEPGERKQKEENKTNNEECKKEEANNKKLVKEETKVLREGVTKKKVEQTPLVSKNDEDNEMRTKCENKSPDSQETTQNRKKSEVPTNDQKTSSKKENESEVESDHSKRKTPPSIEELEKRFEALERQLSTPSLINDAAQNKKLLNTSETKSTEEKPKETEKKTYNEATNSDAQTKKSNETLEKAGTNEQSESKERAQTGIDKEKECDGNNKCKEGQTSIKSFEDKCQSVNKILSSVTESSISINKEDVRNSKETLTQKEQNLSSNEEKPKDLGKRRASEPPSTEDLEKRYETLKRRMSTRNHFGSKSETVDEALQRIEQEVIAEIGEVTEDDEKAKEKSLPTTEDLESRYEALHSTDKKIKTPERRQKSPIKTPANTPVETPVQTPKKDSSPIEKSVSTTKRVDVAIEANIPEPPPMPEVIFNKSNVADAYPSGHQQRALIEELQSKIKGEPGEENLKPSEINPIQRRQVAQRPTPMGDETSEAPANTAYYRSENYEPWQQSKIMVRRFSDLPSRSDLENRLQFLEKQLYRKFYKQRCASDSDVASKGLTTSVYDERPSTSKQSNDLEKRVLALEKQLSENSLKLLEAMRAKAAAVSSGSESDSPRRLSTETIDATGKELVRYEHFGELDESENSKPISISINIKMLMNKEGEEQKRQKAQNLPSTEELRLRLETLEQELNAERAKNACHFETKKDAIKTSEEISEVKIENPTISEKIEKDTRNEVVKEEENVKTEKVDIESNDDKKDVSKNCIEDTTKLKETESTEVKQSKETITKIVTPVEVKQSKEAKAKKVTPVEEMKQSKETIAKIITPVEEVSFTKCEGVTEEPLAKREETEKKIEDNSENKEISVKSKPQPSTNMVINATELGPVDPNNKTLVLLMDNEPKAVKVRRLTRANTEELEGLFQALEKQLSERNLIKSEDGKLIRADSKPSEQQASVESKAITDLSKEIQEFTSDDSKKEKSTNNESKTEIAKQNVPEEFDWGPNPVKHHLKRSTVHLPSTKELEARFRSLERQIKLLEDVENIDVEQRLIEIERKIKLQYSLSHEKDLNKYLELCEGKGLDDEPIEPEVVTPIRETTHSARSPGRQKQPSKSPYTSPSRKRPENSPHTSPSRSERKNQRSPFTSPARSTTSRQKQSPYTSPARRGQDTDTVPVSDDLEYRYRVLDLVRSKSKERLAKKKIDPNKPPIHPLEMLLDPSPDEDDIPTTGELEHRIRVLDGKLKSPTRKPRSQSPTIDDMKRKKRLADQEPKTPVHDLEKLVASPTKPEPPTEFELEARMRALEEDRKFDFKTQKDYKEFNRKLKDIISPSLSFEEFKAARSREQSPRRGERSMTPKSALRDSDTESRRDETIYYRPTSPKVIRFRDEDEEYYEEARPKSRTDRERSTERMVGKENGVLDLIAENTKILERILQKTLADSSNSIYSGGVAATMTSTEGLDTFGTRLMRETSPLRRTGTHTGVPLRTGENINDRLSSIKETIKSIDSLCTEKPYQKEKCQRYIDSLFIDSQHFSSKKSSMEDLHSHSRSESRGRVSQSEYTPAIRITSEKSSAGQRSSDYRNLGSTESIRITSPLSAVSPSHHRSNRDLRRDVSPRRRRDEEREEYESSRVRRDNLLPNYSHDNSSDLSSYSSLTKFHKVDRQLNTYKYDERERSSSRSASRSPLRSPYESRDLGTGNTITSYQGYNQQHLTTNNNNSNNRPRLDIDRPVSPYRQPSHHNLPSYETHKRSNTPAYTPAKLEIRHTTVTSTFYDRLLTEKQIEKSLTRPPSRSPVISPSITSKSYNDLPNASLSASRAKDDHSITSMGVTSPGRTLTTKIGVLGMASSFTGTSLPTTSAAYLTATSPHATISSSNNLSATSANGELRIRSCENILTQLKAKTESSGTGITSSAPRFGLALPGLTSTAPIATTVTTVQPISSAIVITTTSLNQSSFAFTDTYKSYLSTSTTSTNATSATNTAATVTTSNSYATGVYNPLMSLTLRQPISTTNLLGQYSSSLTSTEKLSNEQSKI